MTGKGNKMTKEQEAKLAKMSDQKLLIELAIAFGNTPDYELDEDDRSRVMSVFEGLSLDHIGDYPYSVKEGGGS